MYARVTTGQAVGAKLEEAIGLVQARTPWQGRPGYRGDMMLVDRQAGKVIMVGLWEVQEDAQATMAEHLASVDQAEAGGYWVARPSVDVYEVAVQHEPLG